MKREITMESVFRAGFEAGFSNYNEYADTGMTKPGSKQEEEYRGKFLNLQREAWLAYVKELEDAK